jgi:hypothetical protein
MSGLKYGWLQITDDLSLLVYPLELCSLCFLKGGETHVSELDMLQYLRITMLSAFTSPLIDVIKTKAPSSV